MLTFSEFIMVSKNQQLKFLRDDNHDLRQELEIEKARNRKLLSFVPPQQKLDEKTRKFKKGYKFYKKEYKLLATNFKDLLDRHERLLNSVSEYTDLAQATLLENDKLKKKSDRLAKIIEANKSHKESTPPRRTSKSVTFNAPYRPRHNFIGSRVNYLRSFRRPNKFSRR
jgi:hypothetical protein